MRDQIANGVGVEIETPGGFDASERWYMHIPTGSLWLLVPAENPYGPGFWPARDEAAYRRRRKRPQIEAALSDRGNIPGETPSLFMAAGLWQRLRREDF
jgi:hypothetical protein